MSELSEPIPAATLVLMRKTGAGPPELLVMERTGHMVFAAGALVFPGGRIDAADHATAASFPGIDDAAARIAAVRETIEETGLAPAISPTVEADVARALREGIERERPFQDLLAKHGLALDLDALTPFARWCPNFSETRRFDTLFYLAEAPADAPVPTVSEQEAVRLFWATATEIIAEIEAGRASAVFPTRRNLERLAMFGSIAEARAHATLHPVRKITPWVEDRHGEPHVCIPEDAGYPVTSERLATVRRH
ncbi:MAG: NUDIX hydrolase [Allosphingosinicella sp.]